MSDEPKALTAELRDQLAWVPSNEAGDGPADGYDPGPNIEVSRQGLGGLLDALDVANARAEAAEAEVGALRDLTSDALDYIQGGILYGKDDDPESTLVIRMRAALAPGAGERVAEKYAAAVALADAHVRAQECSKAYIHERDKKGKRGAKREARLEELAEADLDACEAVERALDTYRAALDALDGGMR